MCFDAVREGRGLWFSIVEELAPLLIRRGVRGVLIPKKSEVYFHTA